MLVLVCDVWKTLDQFRKKSCQSQFFRLNTYVWMTSAANANIMLDKPAGCFWNWISCQDARKGTWKRSENHLFTSQKGVKNESRIGHSTSWQRMVLLHAPRIRCISLSHVRDIDIIFRAISLAELVVEILVEVTCWRMRKILIHWGYRSVKSEIEVGSKAKIVKYYLQSFTAPSENVVARRPGGILERKTIPFSNWNAWGLT